MVQGEQYANCLEIVSFVSGNSFAVQYWSWSENLK